MLYRPYAKEYNMTHIWNFARRLTEFFDRRERERRDAYLAQSVDVYDLERRMRELDKESRRVPAWMGTTAPW
jgi:hypothetical protein